MSRKSGKGTTKKSVRSRRVRNTKKARLSFWARRFGFACGFTVFILWIGLWVVLSGWPQRTVDNVREGFYAKTAASGFVVKDLLVEGRENTDADVLLALLNVEKGDPLFAFHPDEAREMIERISWVREVRVERRMPDTIYISLIEREPMALWQHEGRVRLVDTEGVVLAERNLKGFSDLPILVGAKAPEKAHGLFALIAAEPELSGRMEAASWVSERRWDLKLRTGATVKLPEEDIGLALRRLVDAQEKDALLDKDLEVIDVRMDDRIVVRTRPGAVREYKASMKAGNSI